MHPTSLRLHVDSRFLSPYAMQAFVALHEKSLAFELATVDLESGAQHAPDYAERSLTGRVPTLVHDGFSLSESTAITEYLDEAFPGTALYPRLPRQRARARQVQAWLRTDLASLRQERSTEVVFCAPSPAPLSEQARAAADKLFFVAGRLLADGAAHLFDAWSIVDLDLAIMLQRLLHNDDPVPPALAAYARAQWLRPSVRRWVEMERAAS